MGCRGCRWALDESPVARVMRCKHACPAVEAPTPRARVPRAAADPDRVPSAGAMERSLGLGCQPGESARYCNRLCLWGEGSRAGSRAPGRVGSCPPLNRGMGSPAQGREARRAQGAVWSVEDGESLTPENVEGRDVLGIASLGQESVEMQLLGETFGFSA